MKEFEFDRRSVIKGSGVALATGAIATGAISFTKAADGSADIGASIALEVNGKPVSLAIDPRTTLLDLLRDRLDLTGTKVGCNQGTCGACTVHIDGRRVLACLTLGVMANGHSVTTIEGLTRADGALHPMQRAFVENDALQCGYCTPGQIMSGVACVREGHADTDDDIREYMSGNLCRCAAYPNIVAAIGQARQEMQA